MEKLPQTYTAPGLVDIQVNGYAGVDFNNDPSLWTPDEFHLARKVMMRRGVVAALPTFITDDAERMLARAARYGQIVSGDDELAAFFPKLHVEGPFISPARGPRGAHPKRFCRQPDEMEDFIDQMRQASDGRVGVVTLAPELPGAVELIRRCSEDGLCVAIGHTQASAEQLDQAVRAGAKMSTHLGNGSHQHLSRLDNYVQAQLADDRLAASFIADGHHMPMTTLKNFIRAKTPARSVLVTDAIVAAELGPGEYDFGGRKGIVTEAGYVYHPGEENLAGSAATLDMCVIRTCLHCDVSFEQAWAMASSQPADLAGLTSPPEVAVTVTKDGFVREN